MKNLKTLFVALLTVATITIAKAQIPSSGLIAHWSFNGHANDVSGNAHHGNPSNVVSTAGRLGLPNTAYRFNSANSFISVPNHPDWNTNHLTICAIMKADTFYDGICQGNYIISRGVVGTSGSFFLSFFDNPYNDCFTSDTNMYVFSSGGGPGLVPVTSWQNTLRVHSGIWYCVVMTFDGSFYRVYVDGTLENTVASPATQVGSSTDSVCIGKFPWGGSTHPYNFTGVIDDIAIYNRALTPAEVAQYCNAAIIPDTICSISQPIHKTALCPGDTVHISYQASGPFGAGNIFTAQLSDNMGSFASPVAIGSFTSTTSGSILCTIPANTPTGSGYRIRIVSSAPVYISPDNGVNLTVNPAPPKPQVTITPSPGTLLSPWQTVTFTATITNGGSAPQYQWLRNGQPVPGATTNTWSTYSLSNNDKISVVVYSSDTCNGPNTDTSEQLLINIKTGITNTDNSSGISIYPNPGNGNFVVEALIGGENIDFEVINSLGQVIHRESLIAEDRKVVHSISLKNVPSGHYLLKLRSGNIQKQAIITVQK